MLWDSNPKTQPRKLFHPTVDEVLFRYEDKFLCRNCLIYLICNDILENKNSIIVVKNRFKGGYGHFIPL